MSYLGKESMVPRQSLPQVYTLNGAFYIAHQDQLLSNRSFFTSMTLPFIMSNESSLNLDTQYDLYLLEALIQRGIVSLEIFSPRP